MRLLKQASHPARCLHALMLRRATNSSKFDAQGGKRAASTKVMHVCFRQVSVYICGPFACPPISCCLRFNVCNDTINRVPKGLRHEIFF